MCGIFGLVSKDNEHAISMFKDLFLLSESRGKEASGFALISANSIMLYKIAFPASTLVKTSTFKKITRDLKKSNGDTFVGIGHSRLVTNGHEQHEINNQPVEKDGLVVVHNGIIVNYNKLWDIYKALGKNSEIDTELIPTILSEEIKSGKDLGSAIGGLYNLIEGMTSFALLSDHYNNLILATNNGSIYYYDGLSEGLFAFASESHILRKALHPLKISEDNNKISQLLPRQILTINFRLCSSQLERIGNPLINIELRNSKLHLLNLKAEKELNRKLYINKSLQHTKANVNPKYVNEYLVRNQTIQNLKRCVKCTLPATFPNIKFDDKGECNYCKNYHKINYLGLEPLKEYVEGIKRRKGRPDCLIPLSGGRDSCYTLHYVVKELGLKPIAYSYDWGMLTDLSRRNQSRLCGKLGVEHILVSADIRKKRSNISKNVSAWLKKPHLGLVPLFMAGDKQYFYYSKLLQRQNGLELVVMGENPLEKTMFKSGFSGAKQNMSGYMAYHISLANKARLLGFYLLNYIKNPSYLNSSLVDTIGAFFSYYSIRHDYLNLFNYLEWEENTILNVLINEYDWETDPETTTTWRIGDGTAAFYNYIYFMVAGFTENDTFRSNQIREGAMTRNKALKIASKENIPRWDSIMWYCNTLGLDFNDTIDRINMIKTLY